MQFKQKKKIHNKLTKTSENAWTFNKRVFQFVSIIPFKISGEQNFKAKSSNSSSPISLQESIADRDFNGKPLRPPIIHLIIDKIEL